MRFHEISFSQFDFPPDLVLSKGRGYYEDPVSWEGEVKVVTDYIIVFSRSGQDAAAEGRMGGSCGRCLRLIAGLLSSLPPALFAQTLCRFLQSICVMRP